MKPRKLVKVVGKGPGLGHTLGTDPNTVRVILTLGGKTYCMQFGGTTGGKAVFTPNISYKAADTPAPPLAACLP